MVGSSAGGSPALSRYRIWSAARPPAGGAEASADAPGSAETPGSTEAGAELLVVYRDPELLAFARRRLGEPGVG